MRYCLRYFLKFLSSLIGDLPSFLFKIVEKTKIHQLLVEHYIMILLLYFSTRFLWWHEVYGSVMIYMYYILASKQAIPVEKKRKPIGQLENQQSWQLHILAKSFSVPKRNWPHYFSTHQVFGKKLLLILHFSPAKIWQTQFPLTTTLKQL